MTNEEIAPLLDRIGALVKLRAKMNCPVDMGALRTSIQHRVEGNKVIIFSNLDYAKDIEYGTPPGILDNKEKEELREWSKRHGLYAPAVISKIEKEGIKVGTEKKPMKTPSGYRPYLRPAVHQSIPEIKRVIQEAFK